MVWKALEALGMLSEALGSFDVNTVCPLPGSWINHVVCFVFAGNANLNIHTWINHYVVF